MSSYKEKIEAFKAAFDFLSKEDSQLEKTKDIEVKMEEEVKKEEVKEEAPQ